MPSIAVYFYQNIIISAVTTKMQCTALHTWISFQKFPSLTIHTPFLQGHVSYHKKIAFIEYKKINKQSIHIKIKSFKRQIIFHFIFVMTERRS